MLKKTILFLISTVVLSSSLFASPSLNDMQSCQGLLDFIDKKLEKAPSKYPSSDIKLIKDGLNKYNKYIQNEIITPGLANFNKGDYSKAKLMQKQVDAYKANLVKAYSKKYPQNRLYSDYAIAVNNCAKLAVPKGKALEKLKASLHTIIKLAKMK